MAVCVHLCTSVSRVTLLVCNTGEKKRLFWCQRGLLCSGRVERVNIYSGCTKTYSSGDEGTLDTSQCREQRFMQAEHGFC